MKKEKVIAIAGTIDLTPTWQGLLFTMIELHNNATTAEARRIAKEELIHMAQVADYAKTLQDGIKLAMEKLETVLKHNPNLSENCKQKFIEVNSILYNLVNGD